MRTLIAAVVVMAAITFPAAATANPLDCSTAKRLAGHPNAGCYKTSPNHAWLTFPWHACQEHVYWWHPTAGAETSHIYDVVHCSSWSHGTPT